MEQFGHSSSLSATDQLFRGGGETGHMLSEIDWSQNTLGPIEVWPQSLRISLRICLTSRHPLLIWWGNDLVKIYNDAYRSVLGKRHPWALGRPGREVWPEIWDIIGPMLEGVLKTGQATWSDDQLLLLERNGYQEECYFTFSYSPIEDEGGQVVGVFTAVTETTERVLAERRARFASELAGALVDARTTEEVCARAARLLTQNTLDIPFSLLYRMEPDGKTLTFCGASNIAPGTPLSPQTLESDAHDAPWPVAQALATHQPQTVTTIDWRGRAFPCETTLISHTALIIPVIEPGLNTPTLIWIAGVSPRLALGVHYDAYYALLTGHLSTALAAAHAYEAERRRAEELSALDRAKTAFFSNVSHEFRTPLTLMLGPLTDSLADESEPLPPTQLARQEVILRNAHRLLKLVNSLLDFSRIEAGRIQASYMPTDLAALTRDLASSFRSLIEKAGLTFQIDCPPLPEPIYVDRDMWEKIVLNLLSNAYKFTFEGEIAVRLRMRGGEAELSVSDTGVGVPKAELPRLFERFHRVAGTRARTHEGSGIGLALVQELVHLHGGSITVQSRENAGTTFTVRVPTGFAHLPGDHVGAVARLASTAARAEMFLEEAERWAPGSSSPSIRTDLVTPQLVQERDMPLRGVRILLADDNADMREYLTKLLGARYEVTAVANGAEALKRIFADPPDLVVSDVMMPEVDGFELIARVRAEPRTASLPIILLSARAGEEATIEGLSAGADDYLIKPFSAREVLSRVAARLEIFRTRREEQTKTRQALDTLLRMAGMLLEGGRFPGATLYHEMIEVAQHILGVPMLALLSQNEQTKALNVLALVGYTNEQAAELRRRVIGHELRELAHAEEYEKLSAGQPVIMDLAHPPYEERGTFYNSTQAVIIPLRIGNEVNGALLMNACAPQMTFTAEEIDLAEGVVGFISLALERERLLNERVARESQMLALQATNQRMDEFIGVASHELKTPMTSLMANVQMSERGLRSWLNELKGSERSAVARYHHLLERTERQVQRLDRLINDLLDVSRISAGKLEMRPEPCNVVEIVRDAIETQRAAWPHRMISFVAPERSSMEVMADADRIVQVVTNLLTNALKYSAPDCPVVVRAYARQASVRVEVHDEGPGLTGEQQSHLFERFYRAPGIVQRDGSGVGLGLGLSICKTIIERHAGAMGVESVVGKGSVFSFTLPRLRKRNSARNEAR